MFTTAWVLWLVMFAVIEGIALKSRKSVTFSAYIWRWFSVRDKGLRGVVGRALVLFSMALLTKHFVMGGGWL